MKIKNFKTMSAGLLLLVFVAMTACKGMNENKNQVSGIHLENLDTSAKLGNDFYQFATGGWQELNPLTAEYARFGSFDMLAENNREQLKGLIEEIASSEHESGSIEQKIADLFNMAMDSTKLNEEGVMPIMGDLEEIAAINNKDELTVAIAQMMKMGMSPYFYLYVGADQQNSDEYLLQTHQGGMGLGQRDYYLEDDDATKNIRQKYQEFMLDMFLKAGKSEAHAAQIVKDVFRIEAQLAKAAYDNVKLRDPHANYNKMSISEIKELAPGINWDLFFETIGVDANQPISVSQKEHLIEVGKIISTESLEVQKSILEWNVINSAASYLSDDIYMVNFDFYGRVLSGRLEPQARWKRAVSTVDGALGEAVGQMYVKKYFPAEAKERMLDLVHNLQSSLEDRILELEWMGDDTKKKAVEKLNTFHVKIGYPDKWKDYSTLQIEKDSYWANIKRANEFSTAENFDKLGKPVDKDEWFMTPQTVNAYYNPTSNEICFPAGILQYPFFDMNADDAFNYGAIGVVIGHEMTHGFDDQGRQFDKEGNLKDWWTEDDAKQFDERATKLADFYDKIEVAPGVFANGRFTLGENIADQGGLQVSYQAFEKVMENNPIEEKDGFSAQQRFFLAYANVWAGNIRHEEILKRTKTDPHSLGKWRVNAALPHIDAWYDAFDIQPEDDMYIAPEERAVVW